MSSFKKYQELAKNSNIKSNQKVGRYADQNEEGIFPDLLYKIKNLSKEGANVCDIGCGCSRPVFDLIENGNKHKQKMFLIDSSEMLSFIPASKNIEKISGQFPSDEICIKEKMDAIIIYSVFHYIVADNLNWIQFIDSAVELLDEGGELLIGDIPNYSKKKRFLSSEFGGNFHKNFNNLKDAPEVEFSIFEKNIIDDAMILFILNRYRTMGFDTFLLPQRADLPFGYTREDILIRRF